jgi:hypothetical protein
MGIEGKWKNIILRIQAASRIISLLDDDLLKS